MRSDRADADEARSAAGRFHGALGAGRPGWPRGLDAARRWLLLGRGHAPGGALLLRHHRDQFPYRDFLAREIRAGPLLALVPGLYCGLPLYSESQAGYLHPFKYLLYPWLETWKAFNLDTVLSVWLTGAGDVRLAPPARRAGGGADRRGGLRARRVHLGPPDPHEHDQRPGERAVRGLGPGSGPGSGAAGGAWCWGPSRWPARSSPATSRTPC